MPRRLPAEWEPQDAVLLTWPHPQTDWAPILEPVETVFLKLIKAITRFERVILAAQDTEAVREKCRAHGIIMDALSLFTIPSNDTWARDFGPITVLCDGKPLLLDYQFNGWGGKFSAELDNQITSVLHQKGAFGATPRQNGNLILEGGSIESDGEGTLLTTSQCLLNPNRNPSIPKTLLENKLSEALGVSRFLWLEHGYLAGDDTDSHIDTLARLCPDRTIAYVRCSDPNDEHYPELRRMEEALSAFTTADGSRYRLIALPWPRAQYDEDGQRLPATYANFLVINGAVLVPLYNDPQDDAALRAVQKAFPNREIIGIDCSPLIRQHGSLHCLTMQLPQGVCS